VREVGKIVRTNICHIERRKGNETVTPTGREPVIRKKEEEGEYVGSSEGEQNVKIDIP
jgi:hypothetical protein